MAVHEINIYGDIVPFKWFKDGSEFDRSDLNSAIDGLDLQEGDELIYNIHTFGGCTTTAFAMYNKLKRVKNEKKIKLTSRADGFCASSGLILLLAADKRVGSKFLKPFVHNAWTFAIGDKNEVKKIYEDLEKVDQAIAELYSEETSIPKEQASNLMNESRDLTLDECLEYGFYTELENVKVVEAEETFNSIILRRQNLINNMSKPNNEAKKNDLWKQIENFFKPASKNKIVYTADNSELDFYELADDATPKAKDGETPGDKAKFDGKPAGESNNGEYIMPSGETYKFTGEELTEIVPKSEDNTLETENAALKNEIENLKTQISTLNKEKTTLNKRVTDAEAIIKNFKELENDDEEGNGDENTPRNPKPAPTKRNLFKNVK